jgi:hypothetical protein
MLYLGFGRIEIISERQIGDSGYPRVWAKRDETNRKRRMSWQAACELGFRWSLAEWERLMVQRH